MSHHFDYDEKGLFRILQLTDLHYEDGGPADQKTLSVCQGLIAREQPQLIILTGDFNTNAESLKRMADALRPVTDSGIPFCYVFGNHDAEYGAPRPELVMALAALPGCINPQTAPGVSGYSNFRLSLGGSAERPDWLMMGIDSGMYNDNPLVRGYDYVRPSQIAWYVGCMERRAALGGPFGALCFLHIPLPEYREAYLKGRRIGQRLETECPASQNSGFYSAMLAEGHTRGVFAGHDHLNDYCADLHGLALCFGRAGGYSTYGRRGYPKGGRMICLERRWTDRFESWVRLEDGREKDRFISSDLWPRAIKENQ